MYTKAYAAGPPGVESRGRGARQPQGAGLGPEREGVVGAQVGGAPEVANAQQCVTDSNFANQYVFYVDALHPTSRTSAIIAHSSGIVMP